MAYKGKSVLVASGSHLMNEVRDFLVSCGWSDDTPTGQDDQNGMILGYFLSSTGESGNDQHYFYLSVNDDYTGVGRVDIDYLASAITDTDTTVSLNDASSFSTSGKVRIGDEVISYTGKSGNNLTGCSRGVGITTAASHSADDVVQQIDTGKLQIDVFAVSDLSTAIASASGSATIGLTSANSVPGLSGYNNDRFNHYALLKVTSGTEAGKMRWITDYSSSSGDFTYQSFLNTPGSATCDILSGGFMPAWSRRASSRFLGRSRITYDDAGFYVFMYGSKDGLVLVEKVSGNYYVSYFGKTYGAFSDTTTTLSSAASAGDTTISVTSTDIFEANQKYRIISTDVDDWDDNKDRQVGDGWPPLDPEEIPTEEFVVQSVGTGTITLSSPLIYSYRSGAVIGECPRFLICSADNDGNHTLNSEYSGTFLPCDKTVLSAHASHRQTWRAVHASGNPKSPYNSSTTSVFIDCGIFNVTGDYVISDNNVTNKYVASLWNFRGSSSSYEQYGVFRGNYGCSKMLWGANAQPMSANSEDTFKAMWSGKHEVFRVFKESENNWFFVGPEIA